MASIIAKHETGKETDPSSVDVLAQLDRYAPTEIDDREDGDDEAAAANSTLHPQPAKSRKRQRNDETPPSTNSSEMDGTAAPMFDIMPNPQFNAGSRPPDSTEAFDTMLHFMQSMQSMQNRTGAPTTAAQQNPGMAQEGTAFGENSLQPSMMGVDNIAPAAPSQQQDIAPFDFTSLIDWETSLANFQNDPLLVDDGWSGDFAMEPDAEMGPGNDAYANTNGNSFQSL